MSDVYEKKLNVVLKRDDEKTDNYYERKELNLMQITIEYLKRYSEYYTFTKRFNTRYDLKQGEIYEFDFGANVHAEFSNRHYGLVVSDSNPNNPLVIVCPLKTKHNEAHIHSDVDLGVITELETGNSTLAVVNQIKALDKVRLYSRRAIGLSLEEINKLSVAEEGSDRTKSTTIRLSQDKMKKVLDAYIKLLINGDQTDLR